MKLSNIILALAWVAMFVALCFCGTGCASNRLVSYEDCPVTPIKMRNDYLRGYGDGARQMDRANNEGRY
jgi:hypothetical protein